jgi:hypothetical protein
VCRHDDDDGIVVERESTIIPRDFLDAGLGSKVGLILKRERLFAGPPVLAMVNALFNPALCAFNVALTPTVDPAAEAGLRALLTSLVGRLTLPQ